MVHLTVKNKIYIVQYKTYTNKYQISGTNSFIITVIKVAKL